MARFNFFQRLFRRTAAPASGSGRTGGVRGFFQRIFGRSAAPSADATDWVNQQITDKERLNMQKYETFLNNNPDMQISYDEWDTMVTTLGAMGDTIEKFGYDAYKELIKDMHEEELKLSKGEMSYYIIQALGKIRNSDKSFSQEDAMDLLRDRIFTK